MNTPIAQVNAELAKVFGMAQSRPLDFPEEKDVEKNIRLALLLECWRNYANRLVAREVLLPSCFGARVFVPRPDRTYRPDGSRWVP